MRKVENKLSKKCTCGLKNSVFCPNCSKIKMVICLKNGQQQHKIFRNGSYYNPVWYSRLKYNRYNRGRIKEKMEHSLRNHDLSKAAQVLMFYENKQLFDRVDL